MGDQGDRKTVRAFQCRDYLFEIFDRMSSELECSVDYLINESMREYARAREQTVAAVDAQELLGSAVVGAAPMSAQPIDARPAPMLTPVLVVPSSLIANSYCLRFSYAFFARAR